MTVKEVKEAMDRYHERGLDNLPVGYFIPGKDGFGDEFIEIKTIIRVVDDWAGEVIKLAGEEDEQRG